MMDSQISPVVRKAPEVLEMGRLHRWLKGKHWAPFGEQILTRPAVPRNHTRNTTGLVYPGYQE